VDGRDLLLTVDVEVQRYAQDNLAKQVKKLKYATGGAAVVLKLQGNEILAAASVPGFDPAVLGQQYSELRRDKKYLPLADRVFGQRYPPGSIVKPIVLAAALTAKKISPSRKFLCRGRLNPDSRAFACWLQPYGHGQIAAVRAVSESCDVYFYKVGELLGMEHLCWWYRQVGLGSTSSVKLPESRGLVPTEDFMLSRHGRIGGRGDARNLAIGQGDLEITVLQAANMVASLLRDRYMPVRLVADEKLPTGRAVGFSSQAIATARQGMFDVVNTRSGTAYKYVRTPKVNIAGKTGSAQAPGRPVEWRVKYTDDNGTELSRQVTDLDEFRRNCPVPWERVACRTVGRWPVLRPDDRRDKYGNQKHLLHAWFVGYAPAEDPKVVVAVLIEYGMHGNSVAGPVARDIIVKCHQLGYLR